MFNVTGGEFFMILVVALVVLGPERLPTVARRMGEIMGQLRDLSENFKREVSQALDDPGEPIVKPMSRPQLTALDGGAFDTAADPGAADAAPPESAAPTDPTAGGAVQDIGAVAAAYTPSGAEPPVEEPLVEGPPSVSPMEPVADAPSPTDPRAAATDVVALNNPETSAEDPEASHSHPPASPNGQSPVNGASPASGSLPPPAVGESSSGASSER